MLSQHLPEDGVSGSSKTIRSKSLYGFAILAFLGGHLRSSNINGALGGRPRERTFGEGLCPSHIL